MNRRSFFTSQFRTSSGESSLDETAVIRPEASSVDPYTADLSLADSYHLLRRISFGPTTELAQSLVGKKVDQAIDMLLGSGLEPAPAAPGAWVDGTQLDPTTVGLGTKFQILAAWNSTYISMLNWWIDRMRNETFPAREKMTLFWSGHFTSEFTIGEDYLPPQVLYRQNALLRKHAIGNFRTFLLDITLDAGMLVYLGGTINVKGQPNENYARELMELFSCGIGNYSEFDVREAARTLSGWKAPLYTDSIAKNGHFVAYLEPKDHDISEKKYLGEIISARDDASNTESLVRKEEIGQLIKILVDKLGDATAKNIARKLYTFFVYANPYGADEQVIEQMAELIKKNDFEIRPVMKALFSSQHFFDSANRGVQIKTPAEFVVGLERQLAVQVPNAPDYMSQMEQSLMDPPNVAGWTGYHNWINTKTFPQRVKYARDLISNYTDAQVQSLLAQFSTRNDVKKLVVSLTDYFLAQPVSAKRLSYYEAILLNNAKDYEWPVLVNDVASCGNRVRSFLYALAKAPDFYLC